MARESDSFRAPSELLKAAAELRRFAQGDPDQARRMVAPFADATARAEEEMYRIVSSPSPEFRVHATWGDRAIAWRLAVLYRAVQARSLCQHEEPHVVGLAAGVRTCQECVHLMRDVADNGRCDICGRRSQTFAAFVVQIGPTLVWGDQCPACQNYVPSTPAGVG